MNATTDDRPTVYEALAAVQAGVRAVGKDSRNLEQGYNFRGIDAVVNAVGPQLREHRVLVIPEVVEAGYRDVTTSRGKPSRECTVKVRYRFYGPRGDFVDAVTVGEAMDFGDKGTPKAMSVAFRVALLQALCLPTDEPDADAQSYERGHRDEPETFAPAGPSDEQTRVFTELANRTAAAETEETLKAIWGEVVGEHSAGRLTDYQGNALRAARDDKLTEIRGTG